MENLKFLVFNKRLIVDGVDLRTKDEEDGVDHFAQLKKTKHAEALVLVSGSGREAERRRRKNKK